MVMCENSKPMMLKEFLELDSNAESCDGFGCYPRYLLDAPELRRSRRLPRARSKNGTLAKISAAIRFGLLPFSSAGAAGSAGRQGGASRSFSRRLRGSFWKKRGQGEETERRVTRRMDNACSNGQSAARRSLDGKADAAAAGRHSRETKVVDGKLLSGHSDEEREEQTEQLSPVSVLDFPSHGEEGHNETASPTFHQSLTSIERARHQLPQKIRQFERLAELGTSDLDGRFAVTEDPEPESCCHVADDDDRDQKHTADGSAWFLLGLLEASSPVGPRNCFQKLLVDFFDEGLLSRDVLRSDGQELAESLLMAARGWMDGRGWSFESTMEWEIVEMGRNGRWRCFQEEREMLATDLEGAVLGSLVRELVRDLIRDRLVNLHVATNA